MGQNQEIGLKLGTWVLRIQSTALYQLAPAVLSS